MTSALEDESPDAGGSVETNVASMPVRARGKSRATRRTTVIG